MAIKEIKAIILKLTILIDDNEYHEHDNNYHNDTNDNLNEKNDQHLDNDHNSKDL